MSQDLYISQRFSPFSLAFVVVVVVVLRFSSKRDILNFRVMAATSVCDFVAHSEVKVLGRVLVKTLVCSVEIISRLDRQSKFQMFTPFSGRDVGVPRRYINTAALNWALQICAKYFDEYLRFGKTHRLKN